jgi:hypothetical protein
VGGPTDIGVHKRRAAGKAWRTASEWVDELRREIRDTDDLPEAGA